MSQVDGAREYRSDASMFEVILLRKGVFPRSLIGCQNGLGQCPILGHDEALSGYLFGHHLSCFPPRSLPLTNAQRLERLRPARSSS